jgi:hypothetical protein
MVMKFLRLVDIVSVLKKFPLSHAVEAMTDIPITQSVAPIWAILDNRITDAQSIAKAIVWLMKRKKNTKCMLWTRKNTQILSSFCFLAVLGNHFRLKRKVPVILPGEKAKFVTRRKRND